MFYPFLFNPCDSTLGSTDRQHQLLVTDLDTEVHVSAAEYARLSTCLKHESNTTCLTITLKTDSAGKKTCQLEERTGERYAFEFDKLRERGKVHWLIDPLQLARQIKQLKSTASNCWISQKINQQLLQTSLSNYNTIRLCRSMKL